MFSLKAAAAAACWVWEAEPPGSRRTEARGARRRLPWAGRRHTGQGAQLCARASVSLQACSPGPLCSHTRPAGSPQQAQRSLMYRSPPPPPRGTSGCLTRGKRTVNILTDRPKGSPAYRWCVCGADARGSYPNCTLAYEHVILPRRLTGGKGALWGATRTAHMCTPLLPS